MQQSKILLLMCMQYTLMLLFSNRRRLHLFIFSQTEKLNKNQTTRKKNTRENRDIKYFHVFHAFLLSDVEQKPCVNEQHYKMFFKIYFMTEIIANLCCFVLNRIDDTEKKIHSFICFVYFLF